MSTILSPKKPESKPVAAMPDEMDPAVMAADARRRQQMVGRGGRASTILSGNSDMLMGGSADYSKDKMG